jgi:glycosyltransferase involved in cell wall biosynthesis
MIKKPEVSIIINCHNGEKFLLHALKSVDKQTFKNWEIIFFDNCSADKSKEIIKRSGIKKIRYFYSKKKIKLYHARNLAIEKAKGKFITFLDTDDEWDKNKLLTQLNFFKRNKDYQIIYSNYYSFYKKKKYKKIAHKELLPSGKISQDLLNKYVIGILTVMIKINLIKKYKFDKKFNIVGDFDLFFKLSQKYLIGCIQKPLAFYRIHPDNFTKKTHLHLEELNSWIKYKKRYLKLKGYNLCQIKYYIFKLKIKIFFKTLNFNF